MNDFFLFLIGIAPIVWLFVSLCVLRLPGHIACPCGLGIAAALAICAFGTTPGQIGTAALEGVLFAIWPILLVIVAAMTLYKYSVETRGMERIKMLLTGISCDKRVLILILAWGFGGFLEGVAGFGVPVLIPGCILVSLGFSPMFSVVACLVANSTSTPFAAIGIPATTLAGVTGIDSDLLGFNVAAQLFIPCLIMPFFLVMLTGGIRAIKGVFRITLVAGISFALPMLLVSKFIGSELPTLIGSVCAVLGVAVANKLFYKENAHNQKYHLSYIRGGAIQDPEAIASSSRTLPLQRTYPAETLPNAFQACLPFGIVLALVMATSLIVPVREALAFIQYELIVYSGAGGHALTFAFLSTPGVLILISVLLSCLLQKQRLSAFIRIIRDTVLESRKTALTIVAIVAMAKIMEYSGMTDAIALILIAVFAVFYPLIAPVIGMLGTFITGSDTTCCVLFGSLQAGAAQAIGADQAWIASSNLSGAAVGKIISPQSVAIGLQIGGLEGKEGEIIKQTLKYALVCIAIVSLTTFLKI